MTAAVISLDGKKIAYVESGATSARFHVLTWVVSWARGGSIVAIAATAIDMGPQMRGDISRASVR